MISDDIKSLDMMEDLYKMTKSKEELALDTIRKVSPTASRMMNKSVEYDHNKDLHTQA